VWGQRRQQPHDFREPRTPARSAPVGPCDGAMSPPNHGFMTTPTPHGASGECVALRAPHASVPGGLALCQGLGPGGSRPHAVRQLAIGLVIGILVKSNSKSYTTIQGSRASHASGLGRPCRRRRARPALGGHAIGSGTEAGQGRAAGVRLRAPPWPLQPTSAAALRGPAARAVEPARRHSERGR
jgi:hypothetical protein